MNEMDRRTIMGVAGAGLAVAACSPATTAKKAGEAEITSVNDQWGDDPHSKPQALYSSGDLKPEYICIVYISLDSNKKTKIRHGYRQITPAEFSKEQEIAAEMIFNASKPNWQDEAGWFGHKEVNFEEFKFGHKMRIYFAIDNDEIEFDSRKNNAGNYANLIRFTKYRSNHDFNKFDPIEANFNQAFYGATLISIQIGNGNNAKTRDVLRIDNWYTYIESGSYKPIDKNNYKQYSMNLQLLWQAYEKGKVVQKIPFILDPDGGNMGGTP